jgi:membrane AbrB-like protein
VLSEEVKGTDTTAVTFMQTIRLLSVVFIVPALAIHGLSDSNLNNMSTLSIHTANLEELPFASSHTLLYAVIIAGATWLAVRLRFPTPYLLGPMLASAAIMIGGLHAPHLPPMWTLLAQLAVGAHMGLSMRPASLKNWRRLLPVTLAGSAAIIMLSMGLGQLLTWWHSMSLLTGFLGTAPGGMAEMGVTATIVNADLSMVVAYQMFRILFILLIVPPLLGGWLKRSMKGVGNDGSKKTSAR